MSTWLIASVGIVYFVIGCEMAWSARYALMLVWWGYALAQIGLWQISR
jgi:hypothetical protein